MAVLVEAISAIVQASAIESKYAGGIDAFVGSIPNQTLCADGELARVGFMTPDDVGDFIGKLETEGLVHLTDGDAEDLVVADQLRGFTSACSWAEVGRMPIDEDEK